MGKKAKTSRKGKKAWRANISTADIEEYYEKSTKDALSGGSLAAVPSESLFFIDKSIDLSVKRKIEKNKEKILHCDSVLQRNKFVKTIPSSIIKKPKKKNKDKDVSKMEVKNQVSTKNDKNSATAMSDLWGDKGDEDVNPKQKPKPTPIPAVEIEPPGCSFNPDFEEHQDSLACAVAEEMHKVYQDELGPQPVPLTVNGDIIDEEDMHLLDVDGDDNELDEENTVEKGDAAEEIRSSRSKRVTRVELNKRIRRKEQLKLEAEAKKTIGLSKEIDSIEDIIKEIAQEDEEKEKRHVRRSVAKQERIKTLPPRLGKNRFKPAPLEVLLTDDLSAGSLRKIKGCCTLARDRFKSLEKRGLIAPTIKRRRN